MSFVNEETHDVKIANVKPLEKRVNVVFQVVEKNEEREITKQSGETHRVCDFQVADDTGSIILTLWNEDIDAMHIDSVYKLQNGFVNVFRNNLRLSKGKYGSIEENDFVFDEINEDNNRSTEHVEDPRRRSYGRRSSYGGGGGFNQSQGYSRRDTRGYSSKRKEKRW